MSPESGRVQIDADIIRITRGNDADTGRAGDAHFGVEWWNLARTHPGKTAPGVGGAAIFLALCAGRGSRRDACRVSDSERVRIDRAPDATRIAARRRTGSYGDARRRPERRFWWAGNPRKRSSGSEDHRGGIRCGDAQPHGGRSHCPTIRFEESVFEATAGLREKTSGRKHSDNRGPQKWSDYCYHFRS